MKGQDALFSHESDEWMTPPELFAKIDAEFHFDIDAAATKDNSLCDLFFTKEDSALGIEPWGHKGDHVFLNPPHSLIEEFMGRAKAESQLTKCTVVALIPARTDTFYWHEYVMKATRIILIEGRLSFVDPDPERKTTTATFPSAIVIWEPYQGEMTPPFFSRMTRPGGTRRRPE